MHFEDVLNQLFECAGFYEYIWIYMIRLHGDDAGCWNPASWRYMDSSILCGQYRGCQWPEDAKYL